MTRVGGSWYLVFNEVELHRQKEVRKTQYDYSKLIGRIIEKYGTRKAFAEVVGISENSMSLKLNGKTGFSKEDMLLWGKLLEISVSEFGEYFFAQRV